MANRNALFAKRQRESELKDKAKAKEDRRNQKRTEVRQTKGPEIAWDEAVAAVTEEASEAGAGEAAASTTASTTTNPAPAPTPPAAPSGNARSGGRS
jgi:hypothetical protein